LYRDLQAKYDRAVQDILSLETLKSIHKDKIDSQSKELLVLRACKIENEATMMF